MKYSMIALMGAALLVIAARADEPAETKKAAASGDTRSTSQKFSYAIGLDMGKKMKAQSVDIDADLLAQGIKDGLSGKSKMTDQQIQEVVAAFRDEMMAKAAGATKVTGDKNKQEGEAFLAENKKKPGVMTLPSGLQYKVVKEGTGKSPQATDTVTTNYEGKLIDGTVFDSSYKRGEPTSFPVNQVIKGWTEALQKMKVGSKWQLFIPSELAYGATPRPGGPIPPNAVLIFDIELLDVK